MNSKYLSHSEARAPGIHLQTETLDLVFASSLDEGELTYHWPLENTLLSGDSAKCKPWCENLKKKKKGKKEKMSGKAIMGK